MVDKEKILLLNSYNILQKIIAFMFLSKKKYTIYFVTKTYLNRFYFFNYRKSPQKNRKLIINSHILHSFFFLKKCLLQNIALTMNHLIFVPFEFQLVTQS